MAKDKNRPRRIAAVYSEMLRAFNAGERSAEDIARELGKFGSECGDFVANKLKNATPDELRKLLQIVRHIDQPGIGKTLADVVVNRIIPLDLKVESFRAMADRGRSIDNDFLKQLEETEEIYTQLCSYLRSGEEGSLERVQSLADDFHALPCTLRLSFLQELRNELGGKALPFLKHIAGHDPEVDRALIDLLVENPAREAVEILSGLAEGSSNKETVKSARRALYILREKGFEIAEKEKKAGGTILREEGDNAEQAFATAYDTFGERLLLLAVPALASIMVYKVTLDDTRGLVHFSAAEMPRKGFRKLLKELKEYVRSQELSSLVRIDPDHCRWLLQESYEINLESGSLVPSEFKSQRYRLKPPDDYRPSKLLEHYVSVTDADIRELTNRESELFGIGEVAVWIVEKDQLLSYANRFVEMYESKLVLSEEQRHARLDDIVADFTADYFSGPRLVRMIRRLEDTAYLLALRGKAESAVKLAAVARSLEDHNALKPHPFLQAFMLRSIVGTLQVFSGKDEERSERDEGGIIRPGRA